MSFARVYTAQINLLKGQLVNVEVDISNGLHAFSIVGLPDKAVEEARDRVSSAIKNSGFTSPKSKNQKIVVSLSPADTKKEGSFFDVAISLGYLLASEDISFNVDKKIFLGELSLNGDVLPIRGVLPLVMLAKSEGFEELYVPKENAKEAALIEGIDIYGVSTLKELITHLTDKNVSIIKEPITPIEDINDEYSVDLADIKGQESAKRGLEIAASGGHNIAMYGPPGTGKTMLARAFRSLLPSLSKNEALEITSIYSIAGNLKTPVITKAPFRSPHHTSSYVSVIGGGATPKPGEVTLSHRGVLFLDEFPEFDKRVIESLRQPLEDNFVSISRAKGTAIFPSNFILIAAMNPCPCGFRGSKNKECVCTAGDIARYQRKLSGPIMDRNDIWVEVGSIEYDKLNSKNDLSENTESVRNRVEKAYKKQVIRFSEDNEKINRNSDMGAKDISKYISLEKDVENILNQAASKLNLSARAYHRVLKLARTIADLEDRKKIDSKHILEAIQYRPRIT